MDITTCPKRGGGCKNTKEERGNAERKTECCMIVIGNSESLKIHNPVLDPDTTHCRVPSSWKEEASAHWLREKTDKGIRCEKTGMSTMSLRRNNRRPRPLIPITVPVGSPWKGRKK